MPPTIKMLMLKERGATMDPGGEHISALNDIKPPQCQIGLTCASVFCLKEKSGAGKDEEEAARATGEI